MLILVKKKKKKRIKLEINRRSKSGEFQELWKLKNMLLNKQWIKEVITKEIIKYLEMNKNENKTYQNLWNTAKAMSAMEKSYRYNCWRAKKQERSQFSNVTLQLKQLEKDEQTRTHLSTVTTTFPTTQKHRIYVTQGPLLQLLFETWKEAGFNLRWHFEV